jgi:hypothetical protein
MIDNYLLIIILTLIVIIGLFYLVNKDDYEGFTMSNASESINRYVSRFLPKRGDVGEFDEERGWRRDDRFFADWADIQRLGVKNDFCRMVEPENSSDPKEAFFACALAGTENLSGTDFRTEKVGDGFKRSRDDYMNDTTKSGRQDYCRILKNDDGSFQPMCRRALDRKFAKKDIIDSNPPKEIKTMLDFYDGIIMWLRMRDDLVDYAGNLLVSTTGELTIDETPKLSTTEGLKFNGSNQFLRLGENHSMEFGDNLSLRSMRAVSLWVYFDEFTNNAHIFDFGSGPGTNNVFLGIVGRGNPSINMNDIRKSLCENTSTIPDAPSGAQPVPEMSPQELMKTTSANVDEFECPDPEVSPRKLKHPFTKVVPVNGEAITADLIYEIWDGQQRKMRIKIPNAVKLKTWTHIAITAANMDAFRPDINVYVNGCFALKFPNGFLPQSSFTTHNYIGKSNWTNVTSQYENRDELFKGSIFDFRTYNTMMGLQKIQDTVRWGSKLLGIKLPKSIQTIKESLAKENNIIPVNELSTAAPLLGDTGILIKDAPF